MYSHLNQPHMDTSSSPSLPGLANKKHRGSYNCGRCGLPKKGHVCQALSSQPHPPSTPYTADSYAVAFPTPPATSVSVSPSYSSSRVVHFTQHSSIKPSSNLRRALSFDETENLRCDSPVYEPNVDEEDDEDLFRSGYGRMPAACMWNILGRLPPSTLLTAARVCKGWRDTTRKLWKSAEELRLRVSSRAQICFVGSVIQKCPNLLRLCLMMESDVDATLLACVAFSCPNLETLHITTSPGVVNRITGDELGRFVADKRCLTSLKMEGCSNLGGFVLNSCSLSTIWLADLSSLSNMIFNCPNLKEISLSFSMQGNDSTDLVAGLDCLARCCPKLQNIHIASRLLSHSCVLALTSSNLRWVRMLSLVLGAEITDASVASIVSNFPKLELLDLSGSSITDSGIGMICNELPGSLSKFLLALCPNITSSGIQFATAQLPLLELVDCGMTLREAETSDGKSVRATYQKLIIKHSRLRKLSLWGCSLLDALYLNCPLLKDLNLTSCKNMIPERLFLQCPNLEVVHASGCMPALVSAIESQVEGDDADAITKKRLPDGSKRIRLNPAADQAIARNPKRTRIASSHAILH